MKTKSGQITIMMVLFLIAMFFGTLLLLIGGLVSTKMNEALDQNISVGQVNLAEENAKTFGKFNEMVVVNADWWGISLIFGLVFGLFLSAYFTRNSFPRWGIVLDIFIILFVFLFSLYLSATYQTLLDIFAGIGETFLEDNAPKTSMFMLNLPVFVVIIGVGMMILFHSAIPRKTSDRIQEGGVLRGL